MPKLWRGSIDPSRFSGWSPGRMRRKTPFVLIGENAYYSGLFVDADNRLRLVDPDLHVEHMEPGCACCTHTFNGVPFTRKYDPSAG